MKDFYKKFPKDMFVLCTDGSLTINPLTQAG